MCIYIYISCIYMHICKRYIYMNIWTNDKLTNVSNSHYESKANFLNVKRYLQMNKKKVNNSIFQCASRI